MFHSTMFSITFCLWIRFLPYLLPLPLIQFKLLFNDLVHMRLDFYGQLRSSS